MNEIENYSTEWSIYSITCKDKFYCTEQYPIRRRSFRWYSLRRRLFRRCSFQRKNRRSNYSLFHFAFYYDQQSARKIFILPIIFWGCQFWIWLLLKRLDYILYYNQAASFVLNNYIDHEYAVQLYTYNDLRLLR